MRAQPARALGAHLPVAHGLVHAADRAHVIGATCLQIFIDNPTAWHRRLGLPDDLPVFRDRIRELGIGPLAVHAPYLVNLACPEEETFERSVQVLVHELETAASYGAAFVNLHVGSHRGAGVAVGLARLTEGLARVLERSTTGPTGPVVVLENAAGGGNTMGVTIEEIASILEATERGASGGPAVGICLDLAHLWGAGYDLADPDAFDGLLESVDRLIGLDRLRMVHFNDSKAERGSLADRHQHVGAGRIGEPGLGHIVRHPRLAGVPFYLETPGMDHGYDLVNLERTRRLEVGLPLDELPAEALELPGTRSRIGEQPQARGSDQPGANS